MVKSHSGIPLLNFEGGTGVPFLNFDGGPRVPLLNLRGIPGPTFKLWGGSRVRVPGSEVPGCWSHFYTMPLGNMYRKEVATSITIWLTHLIQMFSFYFHAFQYFAPNSTECQRVLEEWSFGGKMG